MFTEFESIDLLKRRVSLAMFFVRDILKALEVCLHRIFFIN